MMMMMMMMSYISADAQVHADAIASQQYRLSPGNNADL